MAYQSEIEKLEQRFREKPEQWFAALADAYRKAGEVERALDVVRAGLEKRPNYTSGHIVLGRCLLDQINDPEASQAFERVLELDAENIIALKALSEIADRQGDRRAARQWLERLLDVDPMNDEARSALETIEVEGVDEEAAPAGEVPPEPALVPEEMHREEPRTVEVEQRTVPLSEAATGPMEAVEVEEAIEEEEELELETPELAAKISDEFPVPDFETAQPEELLIPEGTLEQPPLEELELERASEYDQEVPAVEMEPISLERVPEAEFEPPIAEFLPPGAELAVEEQPDVEEHVWAEETAEISDEPLEVTPFDEELAWGAGERISREITEQDLEEAERAHEESLESAARYIPGLEYAEVPDIGGPEFEEDEEVEEPSEPEGPLREAASVPEVEGPPAFDVPMEEPATAEISGESWAPAEFEAPAEELEVPEATWQAAPPEELVEEPTPRIPAAVEHELPPLAEAASEEPSVAEESLELPAAAPEPEPLVPEAPAEEPAPAAAAELPLIMPDEEPAVQPEEEAREQEPEPVLTETMAEVYARQGLFGEARHIYEQMLSRRPGDPELQRRLDELDTMALPKRREEPVDRRARFAATSTGGQPLRAMLRDVASAEPPADVMAAIHGAPAAPAPEAPPQPETAASPLDTNLDAVFGEETDESAAAPLPTAGEDVSLASVFGEEPAPAPKPKEAVPTPTEAPATPGPSSYDEFFSGGSGRAGAEAEDAGESASEGEEGEEGFQDWLEGLKT
jgi:tetratricopeptide (TPR) repeat protein